MLVFFNLNYGVYLNTNKPLSKMHGGCKYRQIIIGRNTNIDMISTSVEFLQCAELDVR